MDGLHASDTEKYFTLEGPIPRSAFPNPEKYPADRIRSDRPPARRAGANPDRLKFTGGFLYP
jgi:hypothetical protein